MPATLTEHNDDVIRVKITGENDEFRDLLQRVKGITGRRWNPDDKVWELPNEPDTLIQAVDLLQPELDAALQARVREGQNEVADNLTTKLPDDAELMTPIADKLYPYQRAGVDYLANHPHSILGDDMGLGKTVQALAAVDEYARRRDPEDGTAPAAGPPTALVICPNSLKGVWQREAKQWFGWDSTVIDGKNPAQRRKQLDEAEGLVIINWEKLRLMPELADIGWFAVIADESHRAKNYKAKQTRALWKLKAQMQLALSGTPIMNHPGELWPILRWLYPKQYTSYWRFFYEYVASYEVDFGPRKSRVVTGVRNADKLRFELSDKLVRRTKRTVLDLPEKVKQTIPVELSREQRKVYAEAESEFILEIEKALTNPDSPHDKAQIRRAVEENDIKAITYLIDGGGVRSIRLRQLATSPALLGGEDKSAKLDAMQEIVADADHKQFVIFTWYKGTAELAAARLRKQGRRAEAMTGDTPADERDELVRRFQAGDLQDFICTLSTGGVGLTLTAADTCIFVERDWTPAINEQAEDRLHRIGQQNSVSVLVLEATDTVDTGRIAAQNRLKELIVGEVIGN